VIWTDYVSDKLKGILGYMLLWPVGVVPGPVRYDLTHVDPPTKATLKSYQWECKRQFGYDEEHLPHYDGIPEAVKVTWSTPATAEDLALIANGVAKSTAFVGRYTLPDIVDEKISRITNRFLHQRGNNPAKVIQQCLKDTGGIYGTVLRRDPITSYFHQIGAFNADNLKHINIEGFMRPFRLAKAL